jgi:hypothetical protein
MTEHYLNSVSTTHRIETVERKERYSIELTSGSEEDAILVATALVELTGEGWQAVRSKVITESKVVTEEKTVFTGGMPSIFVVDASPPKVIYPSQHPASQVFSTSVGRKDADMTGSVND